jgi:polysaccharide export outer membrane protein
MSAPVALGMSSTGCTARAAAPAGTDVAWHATPRRGAGSDAVAVAYHPPEAQTDVADKAEQLPPLPSGPEPRAGQTPEGKKPEDKKDKEKEGANWLAPAPLAADGSMPMIHGAPTVPVPEIPRELAKRALPSYVIEPPDILLVEAGGAGPLKLDQPIRGQHLVRPDGTIGLGIYGSVFVGGLTIDQAREAIAAQIRQRAEKFDIRELNVDVLAYNSKFYYVITDGGGYGEQVYPFLITGSETVIDALGRIYGLPPVADKTKIWVARRGPGSMGQILPVDWVGIAQRGATGTNYQLMPGDRIYVKADHWISTDAWIGKRLSPIERIFGATLLGSQTVNSIRNKNGTSGSSQ